MRPLVAISFLRPTLIVLACFGVALLVARQWVDWRSGELADYEQFSQRLDGIVYPDPALSPAEVVRIQLSGLADTDHATGALQCLSFASPRNRLATGPLERFGRMVRREPFVILGRSDAVVVGHPTLLDGSARVFVTAVADRRFQSYVWVLSRQEQAPFTGCWMTDAVFPVGPVGDLPSRQPPAAGQSPKSTGGRDADTAI